MIHADCDRCGKKGLQAWYYIRIREVCDTEANEIQHEICKSCLFKFNAWFTQEAKQ